LSLVRILVTLVRAQGLRALVGFLALAVAEALVLVALRLTHRRDPPRRRGATEDVGPEKRRTTPITTKVTNVTS
jgi:hypothetical protein